MQFPALRAIALLIACSLEWAYASTIRSVEVEGVPRSPIELETRAGAAIDTNAISRDVRHLWATGRFDDIRVESTETPEGAKVVFHVVEKPRLFLNEIRFEGTSGRKAPKIEPGTTIDARLAQNAVDALEEQLARDGYKNSKVTSELIPVGGQKVDLHLKVDSGERYRVQQVRFTGRLGIKQDELKQTLHALRIRRIIPGVWTSHPGYSEDAIDGDLASLRSVYLSRGYFDARIGLAGVEFDGDKAVVTINIESGPRYAVKSVNIVGAAREAALSPGLDNEFPAGALCRCLLDGRLRSEHEGRIDFDVRLDVTDTTAKRTVDVNAKVQTGRSYKVARIEFHGHHSLSDSTLRRALVLNEGELFDGELLRRSLVRLNKMGLLEPLTTENVALRRNPHDGTVNVAIMVKERPKGRWALSGPVGPMSVGGPINGAIATRLPGWGHGLLEASTYYVSAGLLAFPNSLFALLPVARSQTFLPFFVLDRPYLPGHPWLSGFALSPQLGPKGMLATYGMTRLNQGVRAALGVDKPNSSGLLIPVERITPDTEKPRTAGFLMCQEPKRRLWWLRSAGAIASDWLLGATRPF
jgi:outer membrane protein assembly factor BamA